MFLNNVDWVLILTAVNHKKHQNFTIFSPLFKKNQLVSCRLSPLLYSARTLSFCFCMVLDVYLYWTGSWQNKTIMSASSNKVLHWFFHCEGCFIFTNAFQFILDLLDPDYMPTFKLCQNCFHRILCFYFRAGLLIVCLYWLHAGITIPQMCYLIKTLFVYL